MNNLEKTTVVILAGGQGARFWPVSRMARPKQFLSISADGESLIQATARRVVNLVGEQNILIMTNVIHEKLIREHVPYAKVICEPVGRNTAASLGLAALHIKRQDPNRVMIVLPADHAVKNENKLVELLSSAAKLAAEHDYLVTLGIEATHPNTAYGYIKRGAQISQTEYKVNRFFEKPNLLRAREYVDSGEFYWNSGMFAWRAEVLLNSIAECMPDLYSGLQKIDILLDQNTASAAREINKIFESFESISIDFGVLEHAKNCAVVEGKEIGWNDVGSWDAWAEHFEKDQDGNLLRGDPVVINSKNSVVYSNDRMIAVLGCEDLVIIDSKDALLVCPRSQVQEVKEIVNELKSRGRGDLV